MEKPARGRALVEAVAIIGAEQRRRDLGLSVHPVLAAAAVALILAGAVLTAWLQLRRAARTRAHFAIEDRLQFERLLADLSAGLIHIAPSDIDSALEHGLRQVGAFLTSDRGTLDEYFQGVPAVRLSWTAPGIEPLPPVLDNVDKFPWTAEALRRGEVVRFSRLDDLPSGAATDRASYRAVGTRSHVSLPLRASGPMLGALSFDSVRAECPWPDDLVERLRLLSEVFAGALERKRMESLLTLRLRFEGLLASLSVALSTVSAPDVDRFDQEVERSLRKVADFLGVDRGGLIEFPRASGGPARSWASEERLDVDEFPWTTARLRRGDAVGFSRLEELPAEAAVDRQSYLTLRVKSQVAVPLPVGRLVVGGLVFSTVGAERTWPTEVMEQLHLLREVFANTLARRQAELEAQRLRQDLTHIGRVSAMGELTASLAHELNQPLTAILNNAQAAQLLLAATVVNRETIGQILDDIVADDKRAANVIHGLRALLKRGDPEHVSLDLNEVIGEVTHLVMSDAIVRGVPIGLELAADLPRVRGDRIQLQQVVLNLVLNGLEAMPQSPAGDRTLLIRTVRDGTGAVRVEVQDSGGGFDATDADRMFQPLYTTKAQGLGMGLAIVRTIVEAHGGRLSAVNNERGGATFHFTIPVDPESKG